MTLHRIHLPVLIAGESPELDGFVIGCRSHNPHGWVEGNPVNSTLMAFKDMLHFNFSTAKDFIWSRATLLHAFFFESSEVPNSNGLIKGSTGNERIIRVEGGAHHVVTMASENSNDTPILPVPQSHCLIITARYDPWQLFVEFNRSHVV